MGLKISSDIAAIPVSVISGIGKVNINGIVYKFDVGALKNFHFAEQCNHFSNNKVLAFLRNGVECVVLRYDGTGTMFLAREDRPLVKCFKFEAPKFGKVKGYELGPYQSSSGEWYPMVLCQLERDCSFLATTYNTSVIFENRLSLSNPIDKDFVKALSTMRFCKGEDGLVAKDGNRVIQIEGTLYEKDCVML